MTRRVLLGAVPAALIAQNAPAKTPLFDGASLSGWVIEQGPESAFYVEDGCIRGGPGGGFPAWLRTDREYENFDLNCEFFIQGWMDGGIYFCAPLCGRRSRAGFKVSIFHQVDEKPRSNSMGSIYPLIAPRLVNVRNKGEWNTMRIRLARPSLRVWVNGELVHDLDVEQHPDLRYRLRSGFIGLETLSYPIRFRNIEIAELPPGPRPVVLYQKPADLTQWTVTESNKTAPARFTACGGVLRGEGLGNLTTRAKYRDFALQMYIRGVRHHNGGILFRSQGGRDRYEIQLHDVDEAHYPTGSLYYFQRSDYRPLEPEQWFLFQLFVKNRWCLVRINGENVMEYDQLDRLDPGFIELQAHQAGRWIEYKNILLWPL